MTWISDIDVHRWYRGRSGNRHDRESYLITWRASEFVDNYCIVCGRSAKIMNVYIAFRKKNHYFYAWPSVRRLKIVPDAVNLCMLMTTIIIRPGFLP